MATDMVTIGYLKTSGDQILVLSNYLEEKSPSFHELGDKLVPGEENKWGVSGTVASESALRSAGTLLSRVRAQPPASWSDGGPESLRSPCCGLAIYKNQTLINDKWCSQIWPAQAGGVHWARQDKNRFGIRRDSAQKDEVPDIGAHNGASISAGFADVK
ncbi:hypothetical protein PoB_007549400 [Plakobranchus ocellatus]|uniref:Uncharacterized protein n=1 Tax=Plakobranchus ocellatus TaxID=259542 RepID=A0AAV4DY55_9GAST|nr:hypothetical protein PoB_007549400 [Plakobranchus ocellatus]